MSITTTTRNRRKLGVRATPYVFAFYMSAIMAMLMCLVITAANSGIDEHLLGKALKAYQLAMPVAFACVLVVRPLVLKLVAWTVHPGN
jgi:ABC-type transport system involved in cytochrome c biogenesis permease subunit